MEENIKDYFESERIWYEYQMLNSVRHGIQQHWHDNEQNNIHLLYFCKNGFINVIYQEWLQNGTRYYIDTNIMTNDHGPKIRFKYAA